MIRTFSYKFRKLLCSYIVSPYEIRITDDIYTESPRYIVKIKKDLIVEVNKLTKCLIDNLDIDWSHSVIDQLYDKAQHWFNSRRLPAYSRESIDATCKYAVAKILGIEKFFPLLLDEFVNEIYLDSPSSNIYVDHEKCGRCTTNIKPSEKDIEVFLTHLKLISESQLNRVEATLRTEFKSKFFSLRCIIDTYPLATNRFSLNLRKHKKIFTITNLISNNTISIEAAAFLLTALLRRATTTIIGETSTGKTTLLNALSLFCSTLDRKIFLETFIESYDEPNYMHQIKLKVVDNLTANEEKYLKRGKDVEILKTLHRSPDVVFLGEIISKSHSKALITALSAGLRCIQTVHASSVEDLIYRFRYGYGIPLVFMNKINLIVLMIKAPWISSSSRRVFSINFVLSERSDKNLNIKFLNIFKYSYESDKLIRILKINELIEILNKLEVINEETEILLADYLGIVKLFSLLAKLKIDYKAELEVYRRFHAIRKRVLNRTLSPRAFINAIEGVVYHE
jgi:type IV secretory pathway ATPase VirB11/archaellum biosynthesis ATPase